MTFLAQSVVIEVELAVSFKKKEDKLPHSEVLLPQLHSCLPWTEYSGKFKYCFFLSCVCVCVCDLCKMKSRDYSVYFIAECDQIRIYL